MGRRQERTSHAGRGLGAVLIAVVVTGTAIGAVWAWTDTRAEQARSGASNAALEASVQAWVAEARRAAPGSLALERVLRNEELARTRGVWHEVEDEAREARVHLEFARQAGPRATMRDREGLAGSLDRLARAAQRAYAPRAGGHGRAALRAALGGCTGAVVAIVVMALCGATIMAAEDARRWLRKVRARRA